MSNSLKANDFLPIIQKLTHDEKIQLARLALSSAVAENSDDAETYRTLPPNSEEFSSEEDSLSWEGEGWEPFYASR